MTWVATTAPSLILNSDIKSSSIHTGIFLAFKDVTNYPYIDAKVACWEIYEKCTDPLYELLE